MGNEVTCALCDEPHVLNNFCEEPKKVQEPDLPMYDPITYQVGENVVEVRTFETGATRDTDANKLDFEGFLSPLALQAFAEYMHANRVQSDGTLRSSDNWQKGIPLDAYMKSMWRHFFAVWSTYRDAIGFEGGEYQDIQITNLCALLFNVQGMLHEMVKLRERG